MINYFDELMSNKHQNYLEFEAITKDPELAEMVGIAPLSPEMAEIMQCMNALLDRFEEKTEFDRTTVFKALTDRVTEDDDEDSMTFDRMIKLGEKLLETAWRNRTPINKFKDVAKRMSFQ